MERWRIVGYENRVTPDDTFTQDRKEFAEIHSGAATTVLYELELAEDAGSLDDIQLGRVELRWVEPATGDSRTQSATLVGRPAPGIQGRQGSLAHFGAIVALAADLYSGLPDSLADQGGEAHSGLTELLRQLRTLEGELGDLDSYNDFLFLLEHITASVKESSPPVPPSGYSP